MGQALAEMAADQVMDMRNGFVRLSYSPKHDDMKPGYLESLPNTLRMFSNFLGTKSWLIGEAITSPDFHLYEMLDQHKAFKPDCLKEFGNLEAYCDRFVKSPINNKMAAFGAQ